MEVERERVRERLDEMPDLTFLQYLRFLLQLGSLPTPHQDRSRSEPPSAEQRTPDPLPDPEPDDGTWWGGPRRSREEA